jgi:fused signal recognition particle receptor
MGAPRPFDHAQGRPEQGTSEARSAESSYNHQLMGLFDKLKRGLQRTAEQFAQRFDAIVERADAPAERTRAVDVETLEALEELLIMADVGMAATDEIVEAVRGRARRGESLRDLVKQEILRIFAEANRPTANGGRPHVMLIVGVNGTGKTTTVGKLASQLKAEGRTALICAADTFRAAAVDQLQVWADRAGVDIVRAREGSDPAAVVFDAIAAGKSRGRDTVLVDTAGRLHTRTNLMNELEKIRRVAEREVPGAPHEVLLVLDATVGQNGVAQAREFTTVAGVNGIVLTKLDGTAKGGVAVAIAHDLKLPIRYVGVGEGIDDLLAFSPTDYVEALFQEKW